MKGFYLHYRNIEGQETCVGSDRKVADQIEAFLNSGIDCRFMYCEHPTSFSGMVKSCLPGFSDGIDWPDINEIADADFLYIRRPRFISKDFVAFLKRVKLSNPQIKIVMEIPTYPYDSEMMTLKRYPALIKDRIYRKRITSLVDRIADLSGSETIFGISTIPFINGVDLERVRRRSTPLESDGGKTMRIMCAAYFADWHGIDRMVEGLAEYYKKGGGQDIVLHLAGEGNCLPHLKKSVQEHSLSDHVVFHGRLDQRQLDHLYDICNLAIESLGSHRKNIAISSSIKSREYLAKGIPFFYSGTIDVFVDNPVDFCIEVPSDDSPIDIEYILESYNSIIENTDEAELTNQIRKYAEEHVGMEKAMSNVTSWLKDGSTYVE